MSFNLINPFFFPVYAPPAYNNYSMFFQSSGNTAASSRTYLTSQTNSIDTMLRSTAPTFTVSLWFHVNTNKLGTVRSLFTKYDNFAGADRCFEIYFDSSNRLNVYGQRDASNATVTIVANGAYTTAGWHHVIFIYDSSKTVSTSIAQLYVDGAIVTSFNTFTIDTTNKFFMNQTTEASRAYVSIGTQYAGATRNFPVSGMDGYIDEITFWSIALPTGQTSTMYNAGASINMSTLPSYSTGLTAWWRMGDNVSDNWDGVRWNIVNMSASTPTIMQSAGAIFQNSVTGFTIA